MLSYGQRMLRASQRIVAEGSKSRNCRPRRLNLQEESLDGQVKLCFQHFLFVCLLQCFYAVRVKTYADDHLLVMGCHFKLHRAGLALT